MSETLEKIFTELNMLNDGLATCIARIEKLEKVNKELIEANPLITVNSGRSCITKWDK